MKKFVVILLSLAVVSVSYAYVYNEGFDNENNWAGGTAGGYNPKTYTDDVSAPADDQFSSDDAVREGSAVQAGAYAWRLDDNLDYFRYVVPNGVESFSLYTASWDVSDSCTIKIRYSVNESTYTDLLDTDQTYHTGDKVYKLFESGNINITPDADKDIWIEVYNDAGSGAMLLIDTFSITIVPEPMLLGLLPFALFFFRRK